MAFRAVKPEDIKKSQPLVPREHRGHDMPPNLPLCTPRISGSLRVTVTGGYIPLDSGSAPVPCAVSNTRGSPVFQITHERGSPL